MRFVFVFLLLCLTLILASAIVWEYWVVPAYADEYFWYYEEPWKTEPIVCIGQPINKTLTYQLMSKYKMIDAINDWEEKLNNYTGTRNFNIKIFLPHTHEQLAKCNVNIIFVKTIDDNPDSITQLITAGKAYCETNLEKRCQILLAEKWFKTGKPGNTLKHEFGHVLTLGHREGDSIEDKARVVTSFDIMIYQVGKYRVITNADLDALIDIYGKDGWKSPNNSTDKKIYIITRSNS